MQSQGLLPDSPGRAAVCEDVGRSWLPTCWGGRLGGGVPCVYRAGDLDACRPHPCLPRALPAENKSEQRTQVRAETSQADLSTAPNSLGSSCEAGMWRCPSLAFGGCEDPWAAAQGLGLRCLSLPGRESGGREGEQDAHIGGWGEGRWELSSPELGSGIFFLSSGN